MLLNSLVAQVAITSNLICIRLSGVGKSEFFGREQELEKLGQFFRQRDQLTIVAVVGMGGVGKTELALQYARHHFKDLGNRAGGVCWIDAREGDVGTQLVRFAETFLDLKFQEGWNLRTQLQFCWQNWSRGDWLIAIDDVTDYRQQVKPYLAPESSAFQVLLTTRESIGRPVKNLPIRELQPDNAQDLLQSLIGSERIEQDQKATQELCQWLGYLPLGLELVGRYLERDPDLSLQDMLFRLQKKGLEHRSLMNADQYAMTAERGVVAAFELSWERLDENAQQLGCLLSLFALADITWNLVKLVYTNTISLQDEVCQDILEEARVDLIHFNLLQHTGEAIYRFHQLIRDFFSKKLGKSIHVDTLKRGFILTLVSIAEMLPDLPTQQQLHQASFATPHFIEICQKHELLDLLEEDDLVRPFLFITRFYTNLGDFDRALLFSEECFKNTKSRYGLRHYTVAASLNNLAYIHKSKGQYSKAENYYKEAIEIERKLSEENNLNLLRGRQKELGCRQDEPHSSQSLSIILLLIAIKFH